MWADFASGMGVEVRADGSLLGRHNSPRRGRKNTFFCPRRATKGQGEHLFCPRRGAKGREENLFLSTKGHEEDLFLSTEDHEGPRRKPFFVREGARRGAKGQGEHLFCPRRGAKGREEHLFLSAKGREGARRKPFFVREGPRRGRENTFFVREGARRGRENTFFVREGARRGAKNTFFCPGRGAGARGAGRTPFLSAKGREEDLFLSRKGRGGAGRTGQLHLSSDATIAREGHPQGVPLQTLCPGKGAHEGCPYRFREPHGGMDRWQGRRQAR